MSQPRKRAKKKPANLPELFARYEKARQRGKRLYERSDRIMREIVANATPGTEIVLNAAGRKAILVDRFDGKDIVWTGSAARRWEVQFIEP